MKHLFLPVAAAALCLTASANAFTQADPAPAAPGELDEVGIGIDRRSRMTVPISIGGSGPYQFLIDTGAERTVISTELARSLALPEGPGARLHSMSGVGDVRTVIIPELRLSRQSMAGIQAPALKEVNIGASGMLGTDMLQSQRVTFDFRNERMTVTPSRTRGFKQDPDEIVVRARSRFGRLILVDARLDGEKLMVVLDTGSEVTIGNAALRRKLEGKRKLGVTNPVQLVSVTGGIIHADQTHVKRVRVGGVLIDNLPVAFAEVHPFRSLKLMDRPALLLGMDALRLFERVSVDFANREVRFTSPHLSNFGTATRIAALR
jgi:predicted aspartyl protease